MRKRERESPFCQPWRGEEGGSAPPSPAGPAVLKALDVPGCTLDFLLRRWGGTVLQPYVQDHLLQLQHVVSLLYNLHAYVLCWVSYSYWTGQCNLACPELLTQPARPGPWLTDGRETLSLSFSFLHIEVGLHINES